MIAPKNIVAATDFGRAAARAVQYGIEFARTFGARLHLVHVTDDLAARAASTTAMPLMDVRQPQEAMDRDARRALEKLVAAEDMRPIEVRPVILRDTEPGRALLAYANGIEADLIIIGTHGRGGLAEFFLGSMAQKVVRSASCPVLTVRADERDFVQPPVASSGIQTPRTALS